MNGLTMTCFTFFAGAFELLVLAWITKIPAVANGLTAIGLRQFAAIPVLVNVNLNYFWLLFFIGVCSWRINAAKIGANPGLMKNTR
ncbi:hypothetical protein WP50_15515, partial [Lactiplantibacillus plantarum]